MIPFANCITLWERENVKQREVKCVGGNDLWIPAARWSLLPPEGSRSQTSLERSLFTETLVPSCLRVTTRSTSDGQNSGRTGTLVGSQLKLRGDSPCHKLQNEYFVLNILWGVKIHPSAKFIHPEHTIKNNSQRDFPGGPVVKTLCCQCRGHGFSPWFGN